MKTNNDYMRMAITSIVCLLPIILSLVLYDDLPEYVAVHWDMAGNPDNNIPKAVAVFGLPVLFMIINIFVQWMVNRDPKRANTSRGLQTFSAWLLPLISVVLVPIMLFIAMGADIPIILIASAIVGIILMVCGNYLPKTRQNYTVGIKLPWTLDSVTVWNKTHRLASRLFMLCGIITLVGGFLFQGNGFWIIFMVAMIIVLLVIVPIIYSYTLYKREQE